MERRRFVVTGAVATALGFAGCADLVDGDNDDGSENTDNGGSNQQGTGSTVDRTDPEAVAESYMSQLLNDVHATDLVHSDGLVAQLDESDIPEFDGTVQGTAIQEESNDVVFVDVTLDLPEQTEDSSVELRLEDGEWAVWNTQAFQTPARQTDEESTPQVADTLNVISATGVIGDGGDGVHEVQLTVSLSPESESVDLSELSLQYISDNRFVTLTQPADGTESPSTVTADSSQGHYGIDLLTAAEEDDLRMTDSSDRYVLIVAADGDDILPLQAGETAQIELSTADGETVVTELQVPDRLDEEGDTVRL